MAKDHEASTDCCWGPKEKFGEGGGKWEGMGKLLCGGGRCVARGVRGFTVCLHLYHVVSLI